MTATQAPKLGPLDSESVKLLVKGDLLRFHDGKSLVTFNGAERDCVLVDREKWPTRSYHFSFWFFIGRPEADGWMPWSGGENPVPGQRVQWRTRNETDRVMSVLSNNLDWTHECRRGFDPIIAFRLVPTAPVEASGSEREYSDAEILADTVPADLLDGEIVAFGLRMEGTAGLYPSIRNTEEGAAKLSARLAEESPENPPYVPVALSLRPQPSGETRALLERIAAVRARKDFTPQQANAGLLTVLDDCAAALALEGQQEDWRCPDCGAQADEWFDCCKNPARAEAQDEGAAGSFEERAIMLTKKHGNPVGTDYEQGQNDMGYRMVTMARDADAALAAARAHPSPTPAADADRVREAIADVISHESDWRTALTAMDAAEETPEDGSGKPGYWLHQIKVLDRILAALKSTAAKEGEKK